MEMLLVGKMMSNKVVIQTDSCTDSSSDPFQNLRCRLLQQTSEFVGTNRDMTLTHVCQQFCFFCEVCVTIKAVIIRQRLCLGVVS